MSGGLGSVFLGDRLHHLSLARHPSSSNVTTPPTSPPPKPATIDPVLSLQLRIQWLEAIIGGIKVPKDPADPKSKDASSSSNKDLLRRAEDIQVRLNDAVESNESCKKFLKNYSQYAPFLNPAAALSPNGTNTPPTYDTLSDSEFETLLLELEPDIRAADRDLREIDELNGRGISSAGKLPEHEGLRGRLQALVEAQQKDLVLYDELEGRISSVLQAYASHVNVLSELFVSWNDVLTDAEERVESLERSKKQHSMVEL